MKKIDRFFYQTIILSISIFLVEFIFKLANHHNIFDIATIRIFLGSICISLVISFLELFIKDKHIKELNLVIVFIISLYCLLQAGFNNFIGVFISFNVTSQAGAVYTYIFEFFKSFYWYYYFIMLPFLLLILFYHLEKKEIIKIKVKNSVDKLKSSLAFIAFFLVFSFLYSLTINLDYFQSKLQTISNKELFSNPTNPSVAIKQFGTTMYAILDIKNVFLPSDKEITNDKHENNKPNTTGDIDNSDWLTLIENEDDVILNNLNYYFINNHYTDDNSYTGLFENKNLIVIMLESVNDIFINEELYPNFYRLVNSGYYFKNNYSPRNSCATGNNELSGMIGLYSIYNKCTANAYSDNLYPQSIFNLFNNKGYQTTSMHDYTERYYERREIHTNMGSGRYFDVDDLKLIYNTKEEEWASDEDFMKEVVKILKQYDNDERFMTWLTTVTPHQPYGKSLYGNKYLHLFENNQYENYNIKLKRYMSKLKVLDDGLGVLLEGLEKQDKLDDTVIVLYGDHYPYGLDKKVLQEVLPYSIEERYESERVPFVIWSNNLEGRVLNQYTSYVNILPTIANLFNLEFDSRYYAGADLFSKDYKSLVAFADGSWKNEYAFYDASTSKITYYTSKEYTIEEIIKINEEVSNKIKYSNLAIQHDYFNYLDTSLKDIKK